MCEGPLTSGAGTLSGDGIPSLAAGPDRAPFDALGRAFADALASGDRAELARIVARAEALLDGDVEADGTDG